MQAMNFNFRFISVEPLSCLYMNVMSDKNYRTKPTLHSIQFSSGTLKQCFLNLHINIFTVAITTTSDARRLWWYLWMVSFYN